MHLICLHMFLATNIHIGAPHVSSCVTNPVVSCVYGCLSNSCFLFGYLCVGTVCLGNSSTPGSVCVFFECSCVCFVVLVGDSCVSLSLLCVSPMYVSFFSATVLLSLVSGCRYVCPLGVSFGVIVCILSVSLFFFRQL